MGVRYDLHIHSCLSPCADDDMTPATIAGLCALEGRDVIAVCDHNSARNLPAVKAACDAYGIAMIPGIEVNTAEEIHLLCYFLTVEDALAMSDWLYERLPDLPFDRSVWGEQLVMNEEDVVIDRVDRLLTLAVSADIYEVKKQCESLGGIAVPAHADKDSFSVTSVLGFLPEDLVFSVLELADPEQYEQMCNRRILPKACEILSSSDAHSISMLVEHEAGTLRDDGALVEWISRIQQF